jgi:hypothetical protein
MTIANASLVAAAGNAPGDPLYAQVAELDLDNSYPANGYDFAVGTANRTALDAVIGAGKTIVGVAQQTQHAISAKGITVTWDFANTKLRVWDAATGAEIAGAVNLSTVVNLQLLILSW